jgi:ATP-binding cassette subfamily F protein 3
MMFTGRGAEKVARSLRKKAVRKIISSPVNLLLLDEPSNHLDMESNDALLAAIDNFDGAVVMVTHNEMFLHALAERLIVFQGGGISLYEGGYQRFLEKVGWREEGDAEREKKPAAGKSGDRQKEVPKETRRRRSAVLTERARLLKPWESKAAGTEAAIETKERELEALNSAIVEAGRAKRGREIIEISKTMHRLKETSTRSIGSSRRRAKSADQILV